jgi:DNA mismatch repair ATPase MutL
MSTPSSWDADVLPLVSEHIVPYCQKLALLTKTEGIAPLRKWRITRAQAYKTNAASRHEYISVTVVNPEGKPSVSHIAIERERGQRGNNRKDKDPSSPNPSFSSLSLSSRSVSRSVSDLSSPNRAADDKISPMDAEKRKHSDELIYELNFDDRPVYLYELAILAKVVHEVNKSYILTENNCYHYAGTIMKSLEAEYGVLNSVEGTGAGMWCGIDIYARNQGNVKSVLEDFRRNVETFVSIHHILNY